MPEPASTRPLHYAEVIERLRSPGNGQGDLYSEAWNADDHR
ncbi:MAG: hypothetical protein WKF61_04965 [Luteimonas sp.]